MPTPPVLPQTQAREQRLREARQQLRADVDEVKYRPDGCYELNLYVQNFDPATPLYALGPSVHIYVQLDQTWVEVPSGGVGGPVNSVREVTGKQVIPFTFRADLGRYDQLLKGYMHVRVSNLLIVSERAEPSGDLLQRADDYYLYLRPQTSSEEDDRRLNNWQPGAVVPRWIGMPAH
jgi:putative ABC transport system ATP-binding protein/macrolide transport system ATP-binding/permease protein/lipoprotein-releasing system ATP-binding protein